MPSDYALFNYSQAHDVQYVSSLYLERQKVKECLERELQRRHHFPMDA